MVTLVMDDAQKRRASRAAFSLIPYLLSALLLRSVAAQTTNPDAGPLNVHVTAVRGGAQFRPDAGTQWKAVTVGMDASEGVEFRTGPWGVVQFTVGTDQIFRVDRLSVVKVLRANLLPDGTIHTDVGMTYGRVSKDVDLPERSHVDTIISPSSTLAVRGTHVSMYDQPPYAPEAWSLTGAAIYRNTNGQQFSFGSKGGGTNKVSGDTIGAAQLQLNNIQVNPNGTFAGLTGPELLTVQNNPGNLAGTTLNGLQNGPGIIAGTSGATVPTVPAGGSSSGSGALTIAFNWMGNFPLTVVKMLIQDPTGDAFSNFNAQPIGPNVPIIGGSPTAPAADGSTAFIYGVATGTTSFPPGTYHVTLTLQGTMSQSLSQNPSISVTGGLSATQFNGSSNPPSSTMASTGITLNFSQPTAMIDVTPPIHNGGSLAPAGPP